MSRHLFICLMFILSLWNLPSCTFLEEKKWVSLYNGKDLAGWQISEHPESFSVVDGVITAVGERAHLFYNGSALGKGFKDFELMLEVKTYPEANSGIYFHTAYQAEGWPKEGFEVQINNTHIGEGDYLELKKTGSLYGIRNVYKALAKDEVWFPVRINVSGNRVEVWVNGIKTVDYIQPKDHNHIKKLSAGTFALQCHDPGSKVQYRNIRVKRMPGLNEAIASEASSLGAWHERLLTLQQQHIPFIDLNPNLAHVSSMQDRIDFGYKTGINLGFIISDNNRFDYREIAEIYPIFIGAMDRTVDDKVQYVVQKVDFPNVNPEKIGGAFSFIDYLTKAKELLNDQKVDIWCKATVLSEEAVDQYDDFWVPENIGPLLKLAASNNIAIEIDNHLETPSIEVIKMAKAYGCKFSFANISSFPNVERSTYFLDVIEECQLSYKDFFVPSR